MIRYPLILSLLIAVAAHGQAVIQFGDATPRSEGVEVMTDESASDGTAYAMPKGTSGMIQFGYTWQTMGIYEATFYLMVDDNTVADPVLGISFHCETMRIPKPPAGVVTQRAIKGTDFTAPKKWQAFTLTWVAPHVTRNGYQVSSLGAAGVAIDRITIRKVRAITEDELLTYLDAPVPPAPKGLPTGPRRAHLMQGAFSDYWLADWSLARLGGVEVVRSSWATGGRCAEQPGSPQALYGYDLVIMAGTDIQHLPLEMRAAYMKWVNAGGCLVILGGPYGFAQSGISASKMATMLPVELAGAFDLHRETQALTAGPHASPAVSKILASRDDSPVTFFRHHVTAKDGAKVVLGTAAEPLLVTGAYGNGHVVAACFAPMGRSTDAAPGQVAYWDDPRFSAVLAEVLRQTMSDRDAPPVHRWQRPADPSPAAKAVLEVAGGGIAALEADLMGGDDTGDSTQGLTTAQLRTLAAGGGRPAVPILLAAMPSMTDADLISEAEYAVRPHLTTADAELVLALVDSPLAMVRESGIAMLGRTQPDAPSALKSYIWGNDYRIQRSAIRSVREGGYRDMLDDIRKRQATLKKEVHDLRDRLYEGYWYGGLQKQDPIWPYTEATLTLLAAGESGQVADLTELYLLLHLHHIRMRSFIYLYNEKVPREADAKARHIVRNSYLHPELHDTMAQLRRVLSTLPAPLQAEFRQQIMATQDLEILRLLLYSAYDLAGDTPDAEWQAFLTALDDHVITAAQATDRL